MFMWLKCPYRWHLMERCDYISHFQTLKSILSCDTCICVWIKTGLVILWNDVEKEILLEDFLQLSHFSCEIGNWYNKSIYCFPFIGPDWWPEGEAFRSLQRHYGWSHVPTTILWCSRTLACYEGSGLM